MTKRLADEFPNDLWGPAARQRARDESKALQREAKLIDEAHELSQLEYKRWLRAQSGRWRCKCGELNAQTRTWCRDCGEDK